MRALAVVLALAALLVVGGAGGAPAQEALDMAAFEEVADRAEGAVDAGRASNLALTSLRAELAEWRDEMRHAVSDNDSRVRTLEAQLAALGPPPEEGGSESARIAERRAEIRAELSEVRAPGLLAEEARARANGLISEIDHIIRSRDTRRLTERTDAPINPATWPASLDAIVAGVRSIWLESGQAWRTGLQRGGVAERVPAAVLLVAIGLVLVMRSGPWIRQAGRRAAERLQRARGVAEFVISLGRIALPFAGLLFIYSGLGVTGLLGLRIDTLLATVPAAGICVIVARWLSEHLFPEGEGLLGPLEIGPEGRHRLRRLTGWLGWLMALELMTTAFLSVAEADDVARAVLLLPVDVLIGICLFRIGGALARPVAEDAEEDVDPRRFRSTVISILGRLIMAVAVIGPVLAGLGYAAGASALLEPAVMTLAVLGAVILLQRFVFDLYGLLTGREEGANDALAPVLVAFALMLLALPVLALVWGARVSDLTEIWTSVREGFAIGETRLSPSDFLTFAAVFAVGYVLTRLIQGGLKSAVLPKTRLDIGGQNAISAGIGYIGIFAAAIVAITSAGVNLSTLGYVAGALSVGIGFGLQNIVSNFVSGIILLIERPIGQGDWIQVGDQMGYVRSISVRSTRIETFDRTDVIVPNADLISGTVTNWTRGNSVGRIVLPVGVAYGSDTEHVSDILLQIARTHPMVLHNPEPYVFFKGFGESSLDFEIRAILRDVNWILSVQTEMNHAIARRFAEEGIEIPFAQRDIWLRNPEALRGESNRTGPESQGGQDWQEALKGAKPDVIKGEE